MPGQNFPYGLKLGSTTASNPGAGYLRWSGSSVQVYDGATWSSIGSDLSGLTSTYLPKWDGTKLVNSGLVDDGSTFTTSRAGNRFVLTNTTPNSSAQFEVRNDIGAGGAMLLFGSTFPTTAYRNNLVFSAHNKVIFNSDSLLATGGTKTIDFIVGGYNELAAVVFNPPALSKNSLVTTNGIKIGYNTDTASTAGLGSIRATASLQFSDGSSWRSFQYEGYDTNIFGVTSSLYTISNTDYVLFATSSTTMTLPLISSVGVGKKYKIHARNTTIDINRSGSDLIDGATFSSLTGYSMLTLRALQSGDWAIGD